MNKILLWVKNEAKHLLPVIIYFAICFNLFHYAQGLMLRPRHIHFTSYLGATLGAIIAGKVVLITDYLPFINAFPNKPIVYNITWKFCIYGIVVILVQILDYISKSAYYSGSFLTAYMELKFDLNQSVFWGIQIFVLMFFLFYIIFSELMRVVGQGKAKKIFFGGK